MFDRKNMVGAAMKARQLISTRKTLQDQLLEEDKVDLQWLDVSKASQAEFSLLIDFPS